MNKEQNQKCDHDFKTLMDFIKLYRSIEKIEVRIKIIKYACIKCGKIETEEYLEEVMKKDSKI